MENRTNFLYVILLMIFISGCSKKEVLLGVDVQADFDKDVVQVSIDNKEIFNQIMTTNHLLGVSDGAKMQTSCGTHTLKIVINSTDKYNTTFTLSKNKYMGINYDRTTHKITVISQSTPYLYD